MNFSPTFFLCLTGISGANVADTGYLLGLEDADPHHIVLRKGVLGEGLPSVSVGSQGVLRRSNTTFAPGSWVHLRLDAAVNLNGDVVLNVFQNDLNANAVTAPVWVPVPGMAQFIDDALQVNTGSAPLLSGYAGFAFAARDATRRGYFDHVEIRRQL
jgi:hypothetical protein